MLKQLSLAAGYLTIFLVPGVLLIGILLDVPSLAFLFVMFVLPFARPIIGNLTSADTPIWSEGVATTLQRLPLAYAAVLTATMAFVLRYVASTPMLTAAQLLGLGLSLWMTMLFATCVGHELIHRRSVLDAMVGHYVFGLAGYPLFAHEHLRHHARPGNTGSAEWPRVDESLWNFFSRRTAAIVVSAYSPGSAFWNPRAGGREAEGLRFATAVSLMHWTLFAWAGGWRGAALFLAMLVAVTFGMQLVTYILHWGLGDDTCGARAMTGFAWEDDCRLQFWMTMGVSFHHAHHQETHVPYYRLTLRPDSARLPACYVLLMLLSLFPALWRRMMLPALEHWRMHPDDPRSAGRDLTCFHLTEDSRASRITH